ncbi:MAG: GntR family transcriptional regulator [Pseudonocardiaceae bacterium]
MVNPGDPRSPYRQVADALRAEIESGALGPGDPIPSNTMIMNRFKVASSTAQRAVRTLTSEGLVQSVPGRGVFIRAKRPWRAVSSRYLSVPPEGERDRWTTEGVKEGRRATQRITFVGEVEPPEDVADSMRLPDAATTVLRKRVMFLDDEPVELVESYYPTELVRGSPIMEVGKIPRGVGAVLVALGYPRRRAHEVVYTRMPTPDESRALRLPTGTPVFCVVRTVRSDADRPIEVDVMVLSGDGHCQEYEIPLN